MRRALTGHLGDSLQARDRQGHHDAQAGAHHQQAMADEQAGHRQPLVPWTGGQESWCPQPMLRGRGPRNCPETLQTPPSPECFLSHTSQAGGHRQSPKLTGQCCSQMRKTPRGGHVPAALRTTRQRPRNNLSKTLLASGSRTERIPQSCPGKPPTSGQSRTHEHTHTHRHTRTPDSGLVSQSPLHR